jgi:hypothetical protein
MRLEFEENSAAKIYMYRFATKYLRKSPAKKYLPKKYLPKSICHKVFDKKYLPKSICQKVFAKKYLP